MNGARQVQDAFMVRGRCVHLITTAGEASTDTQVEEIVCTAACPVESAPLECLLYTSGIIGAH